MAIVKKLFVSSLGLGGVAALLVLGGVLFNGTVSAMTGAHTAAKIDPTQRRATSLIAQGRGVFRFDTFGDEAVWGGVLGLQKAIEGSKLGRRRRRAQPRSQALAVGLKVDAAGDPRRRSRPRSRRGRSTLTIRR